MSRKLKTIIFLSVLFLSAAIYSSCSYSQPQPNVDCGQVVNCDQACQGCNR